LQWVSLARKVPAAVVAEIRKLEMEGLGFTLDRRRFYPEGSLASSLLGFVAFNEEGLDRGYNGLEGSYDGDLRGNSGKMVATYSAYQDPILAGDFDTLAVQNGSDLYLTINRGVQSLLDKKLVEGVKRFGAKSGSYVVLESSTGKVLAMGNYPNFSPGNFNLFTSPKAARPTYPPTLRNAAISSSYEPGSVMKPVTIATALELGKIKPDWTFNDTGALKIDGATINTWDGRHWGKQTLSQLLQKSNNIGAARVAQAVGREGLRNSFNNFGFGSKLGVDLQGEEAGQVKDLINWRNVDLANAGFGQGVAVTTLQMASAYAAFANGGILMKPYVVEKIVDQDGRKVEFSPQPTRRVISQKTAAVVVELLRSAVEGGESIVLHNLPYRVAGKTGTAEIPEKGGYARDRTNTIFVGFPFKEKNFVMIFRLEEPRTSTFSATTVVPLWVEAFEGIAPLLGVLPSR
ncbi:MAG: peptidoglycan glycosyltransferase, cell division protein FtsI (penicillin-binding protein 3), partial [candidate division CPR1 bacterium GW2011_GWC1_49_13]